MACWRVYCRAGTSSDIRFGSGPEKKLQALRNGHGQFRPPGLPRLAHAADGFPPVDKKENESPGDHYTNPRPNRRPPGIRQSQVAEGAAVAVVALWGVREVGKWGVAVLAAPETGGLSLAGAGALP